jgi:hypothetical protein
MPWKQFKHQYVTAPDIHITRPTLGESSQIPVVRVMGMAAMPRSAKIWFRYSPRAETALFTDLSIENPAAALKARSAGPGLRPRASNRGSPSVDRNGPMYGSGKASSVTAPDP